MNIDWLLIAEIFSLLDQYQKLCKWDLSEGELSLLCEAFYNGVKEIQNGSSIKAEDIIEYGRQLTWGRDHTCDKITEQELKLFNERLEKDWIKT